MTEHAKLLAYARMGDTEAEGEIAAGLALAGCAGYPLTVGNDDFSAIIYEMERDVTGAWGNTMMEPDRYGINTPMEGRPRGVGVENP